MSEFSKVALGKSVESMDLSPQFDAYSGVEIIVDEENAYFSGTRIGRVLQIENKWGTQEQADSILESLQNSGFQYQPLRASKAILDPAAELGDGVTVNGVYTGLYKFSRIIGSLMPAEIETPKEEEIDHEYPYEPKQDRVYKREIAQASAQITLTQSQISAEVTRATQAEGSLSSRITQTANEISSEVTRAKSAEGTLSSRITQNATSINAKVSQTGGSNSSFGWSLLSNKFSLYSGNKEVFKCTSSGVEIQGKITATSGYIGSSSSGFAISSKSIYNGMTSLGDTANDGVYVGTDGIALGKGNFKVTKAGAVTAKNLTITGGSIAIGNNFKVNSSGNVTANNMKLTGTLTVGGSTITADALRSGAQSAYSNSGYWSGGAGYGYNYNNATQDGTAKYPSYFKAGRIEATTRVIAPSLYINGFHCNVISINDARFVLGF